MFYCSNFNLMTTIACCFLILFFGVRKSQFCTALTSDQAWSWIWICWLMNCISVLAAAQSVGTPISISSSSDSGCQCSQRQFSSGLNFNCCFLILNYAYFATCSSYSHISIAFSRTVVLIRSFCRLPRLSLAIKNCSLANSKFKHVSLTHSCDVAKSILIWFLTIEIKNKQKASTPPSFV